MTARVGRIALDLVLALLLAISIALIALTLLLPRTGHQLLIIRSGSMSPDIPVGSLVLIGPVRGDGPHAGDVVTFRLASGALVTHRVTRTFDLDGVPYMATKGDANEKEDPAASPVTSVVGQLAWWSPKLGYAVAFIQSGFGRVTFLLTLLTLIALRYFWEDLFAPLDAAEGVGSADDGEPYGPGPGDEPAGPGLDPSHGTYRLGP